MKIYTGPVVGMIGCRSLYKGSKYGPKIFSTPGTGFPRFPPSSAPESTVGASRLTKDSVADFETYYSGSIRYQTSQIDLKLEIVKTTISTSLSIDMYIIMYTHTLFTYMSELTLK